MAGSDQVSAGRIVIRWNVTAHGEYSNREYLYEVTGPENSSEHDVITEVIVKHGCLMSRGQVEERLRAPWIVKKV